MKYDMSGLETEARTVRSMVLIGVVIAFITGAVFSGSAAYVAFGGRNALGICGGATLGGVLAGALAHVAGTFMRLAVEVALATGVTAKNSEKSHKLLWSMWQEQQVAGERASAAASGNAVTADGESTATAETETAKPSSTEPVKKTERRPAALCSTCNEELLPGTTACPNGCA